MMQSVIIIGSCHVINATDRLLNSVFAWPQFSEESCYRSRLSRGHSCIRASSSSVESVTPAVTPDFYDANYDESSTAVSASLSVAAGNGCNLSAFGQSWPPSSSPTTSCPTQTFSAMVSSEMKSAALFAGQLSHVDDEVTVSHHRPNRATNLSVSDSEIYFNGGSCSASSAPSSPYDARQHHRQVLSSDGKQAVQQGTSTNDDRIGNLNTPIMSSCNKRLLEDDNGQDEDLASTSKKSRYLEEGQTAEDGGEQTIVLLITHAFKPTGVYN